MIQPSQTTSSDDGSAARFRFVSIGECMVEMAPNDVPTEYKMGFAGDTFNTAFYMRQLRSDCLTRYVTRVGQDAVSQQMLAMMQSGGIDTDHIQRCPDRSVGLYLISLNNGERSFSYWRDTSAARQLADNPALLVSAISDADLVYFSGITLAILSQEGRQSLLNSLKEARDMGKSIAFDSNLRPRLWASSDEMCQSIMAAAEISDIVLPSYDDEMLHFGDADIAATMTRYKSAGARTVIIKNGDGPIRFDHNGETGEVSPPPANTVVDTTSAGDSFNAGIFAGFNSNQSMTETILRASAIAGQVIGQKGALVKLELDGV